MRYERKEDIKREENAIRLFIDVMSDMDKTFIDPTIIKLGNHQIDYMLYLPNGSRVSVEIKGVKYKNIEDNHTPKVSIMKLTELQKATNMEGYEASYIVFAYENGIKLLNVKNAKGQVAWGGRINPRAGAANDRELIVTFSSSNFKSSLYGCENEDWNQEVEI